MKKILAQVILFALCLVSCKNTSVELGKGVGELRFSVVDFTDYISVETKSGVDLTALADYDVVMWEKHGVFAVDTDIMSAFDQVDVLNKAALIYIASKNMGFEPEGMSDAQMKELSDTFGLPK